MLFLAIPVAIMICQIFMTLLPVFIAVFLPFTLILVPIWLFWLAIT
jgi:hypothetical protein